MGRDEIEFFSSQTPESLRKSILIYEYYKVWASIMKQNAAKYRWGKLGYIDLFCGKGTFDDGHESTPIMIMNHILTDADLCKYMVAIFNDSNETIVRSLETKINQLPNANTLSHVPSYLNEEWNAESIKAFFKGDIIPSFILIDPFGYSGITIELMKESVKSFGCDMILFFNLNAVRRAIDNPKMQNNLKGLFGSGYNDVLNYFEGQKKDESEKYVQEEFIVNSIHAELKRSNINYLARYRFSTQDYKQATHYILFITKNKKAYCEIKRILSKYSNSKRFANYGYVENPVNTLTYFLDERDFIDIILAKFIKQKSVKVQDILDLHIGKCLTESDIKKMLNELESTKQIYVQPLKIDGTKRKKGGFADGTLIDFP